MGALTGSVNVGYPAGMTDFLTTPQGRRIAYDHQPGQGPGVVFLGGFRSDMTGTKATELADWAAARGRAFLRLDYSGHGASGGDFADGTVGAWAEDARAVIDAVTAGPQVLVGSSMGGWIALLLARAAPERVAALIGIAAAPDFTDWSFTAEMTAAQGRELSETGRTSRPAPEGGSYPVTQAFLDDGRAQSIYANALRLPMPVRLLHGTDDADVPLRQAWRLLDHAEGPDIRLTVVKGGDHRLSTPADLTLLTQTLDTL